MNGKVREYNDVEGYGLINPEWRTDHRPFPGDNVVYFQKKNIEGDGGKTLAKGDAVTFDAIMETSKSSNFVQAFHVKRAA